MMQISESDRALLRSILEKEDENINAKIADAPSEIVFQLGFEGGTMKILRYTTKDGETYYRNCGTNMTLDENDGETWADWEGEPSITFIEALRGLKLGNDLLCVRPVHLNQDHLEEVRQHIGGLIAELTDEDKVRFDGFQPISADEWLAKLRPLRAGATDQES